MRIRFLTLAQREVDDAVIWYEQQMEGLSRDFLDELDRVVRLVKSYPQMATQIDPDIRRFLFKRLSLFSDLRHRCGHNRRDRGGAPASSAALLG